MIIGQAIEIVKSSVGYLIQRVEFVILTACRVHQGVRLQGQIRHQIIAKQINIAARKPIGSSEINRPRFASYHRARLN